MEFSVSALSGDVRAGKLDPCAVFQHFRDAAQQSNPHLNAFTLLQDYPHPTSGEQDDPGLLAGVPIAVKDLFDQVGQTTTAGSAFYRHRPQTSATAVRRLEKTGAVILGRTNLHEFAFGFSSENPWFGAVRNPWDTTLSVGGSSGGSAAAVAAQLAPAALGTDTGGSIRVPAALCGIVGLKVTNGRIPLDGVLPLAPSLDTVGPLTRTVDDARLVYQAIADPDPPGVIPFLPGEDSLSGVKVAIPMAWLEAVPTSNRTRQRFETFCDDLMSLGATVSRLAAPWLVPPRQLFTIAGFEAAQIHRQWLSDPTCPYGPDVHSRLLGGQEVTADQYQAALANRRTMQNLTEEMFSEYHLVLTPTVGDNRKTIGLDLMDLDGTLVFYRTVLSGFTALVNHLGCPAIALPLTGPGIPPASVQLIAPWHQEQLLLQTGMLLEQSGLVGTQNPPWVTNVAL